jgi:NifB/MoaA-like Fe-S oxidoreductase
MTRRDWLHKHRPSLPPGEALLILSSILHQEKTALLAHPEYMLSQREESLLDDAVARRSKQEPTKLSPQDFKELQDIKRGRKMWSDS